LALSLYHSATNLSENDLRTYLLTWRLDLEDELLNDPHGALGRTYSHLANTIPLTFPDPKVSDNIQIHLRLASIYNQAQECQLVYPHISQYRCSGAPVRSIFWLGPDILNHYVQTLGWVFYPQLAQVFYFNLNNLYLIH